MIAAGPPKGGLDLPFEVVREGWSIYKTEDGATIRLRVTLLKLYLVSVDELGNPNFAAGTNRLFAVSVPPEMKGPPNNKEITQKEIQDSIVQADVPFKTVKEEWNEYKVEGAIVSIKPIITVIAKSSIHDINGDPIYNVQTQPIVKADMPPEAKRRFLRIKREKLAKLKHS